MKKLALATLVISLFFGMVSVNAMSEADLKAKLTQTITISGQKMTLPSETKVLVERYLNENEVSSKDCDYIANKVDEAIAIVQGEGQTDMNKLSRSSKDKLKTIVKEVSSNTSVKATVSKGVLIIYNADGTVFAEVSHLVKQTGSETSQIVAVAGVALVVVAAGAYLVVRQVKTSK